MKNKAVKIIYVLLVTLIMPLLFVACDKTKTKLNLIAPTLTISNTEEGLFANSSEVKNANGYCFEINDIKFYSKEKTFNLNNIILEYKTYTIKVYAVGSEDYNNSDYSNSVTYTKQRTFETPVLNIVGTQLQWTEIEEATQYQLKINNSNSLLTLTGTSVDIKQNSQIAEKLLSNDLNTFSIKVKGTSSCIASEFSNQVNYIETTKLLAVTQLQTQTASNKTVLAWNSEYLNCEYEIFMDNQKVGTSNTQTFDITNLLTQAKQYNFAVRALSKSELIESSEISQPVTYTNYIKLETPTIQSIVKDNNQILITWQEVRNTLDYSLIVNNDYYYTCHTNQAIINIEDIELTDDFIFAKVKAVGYNFYKDSEFSSLQSLNVYSTLETPTNVQIIKENGINLSFNSVNNAKKYLIYIDNELKIETEKCFVDISQYLVDTKDYAIKVKCKEYDFFKESEFSSSVLYKNIINLSKVSNLTCNVIDSVLKITWDAVENATSYTVKIVYNNNLIIKEGLTETKCTYPVFYGAEYQVSVKTCGDNDYYISSDYSDVVSLDYYIQLESPTGFNNLVENSYLKLTWNEVPYAYAYELNWLDKKFVTKLTKHNILLSEFEEGDWEISIKAIAPEDYYFTDSEITTQVYTHSSDINMGELYVLDGTEKDFFISKYEELVHLVKYAYMFKKEELTFYANFNYKQDLTDNFYQDYVAKYSNYKKADETIYNELISAIIENQLTGDMQLDSYTIKDTSVTANFTYGEYKVSKTYNGTNNKLNPYFKAYRNGSKASNSVHIETMPEIYAANAVSTTQQLLNVIQSGYKPVFNQSAESQTVKNYYAALLKILTSNISSTANNYQKVLAIYDYLVKNTTYDYVTEKYLSQNGNKDYNLYYSNNIDGVIKNNLATSVGFAKTFQILCEMEGLKCKTNIVTYNNTMIGYNYVCINEQWYVVDYKNSIFTDSTISSTKYQYFTHYYFLDNSSKLSYLPSSHPDNITISTNNYYSNFSTNTASSTNLVIDGPESAIAIVAYAISKNSPAIEAKLDISEFMLKMYFSLASSYFESYEYFVKDGIVFINITLKAS